MLLNDKQMSNEVVEHKPVVVSKIDLYEIGRKWVLKEKSGANVHARRA